MRERRYYLLILFHCLMVHLRGDCAICVVFDNHNGNGCILYDVFASILFIHFLYLHSNLTQTSFCHLNKYILYTAISKVDIVNFLILSYIILFSAYGILTINSFYNPVKDALEEVNIELLYMDKISKMN